MKEKKSNVLVILLVIVLLCGAFIGGYFANEKGLNLLNSKKETTSKKDKAPSKDNEKILGIHDEEVTNALKTFQLFSIEYGKDVKDMSKKELIETAIHGLNENQITYCASADTLTKKITIDDLNTALNKFVKDKKITIDDIKNNTNDDSSYGQGVYGYGHEGIKIQNNDLYVIGSCDGSGPGPLAERTVTEEDKASKLNDELYISRKVIYAKRNDEKGNPENNDFRYSLYKDSAKSELVQDDVNLDYRFPGIKWSQYNTYKLTFKKINDTYYFIKSEKE